MNIESGRNRRGSVLFISGIDTGTGKSVVTGTLARFLSDRGVRVITQKMVQTGCRTISEDIELHRDIMGIPLTDADREGITCSQLFEHPASPHLAASLENRKVDLERIGADTEWLRLRYQTVLIEGAGGLMVPLNSDTTILDYIADRKIPLILVSSSRLGSINHTLLSLEACSRRSVDLRALVYNAHPADDPHILADSLEIISKFASRYYSNLPVIEFPVIPEGVDWSELARKVDWKIFSLPKR